MDSWRSLVLRTSVLPHFSVLMFVALYGSGRSIRRSEQQFRAERRYFFFNNLVGGPVNQPVKMMSGAN